MNAPRGGLRAELPLLFAIFLDLVGFGMVIPDIQTRMESFGSRGAEIGMILASYFVIQFFVSPLWGRASDRHGRKPILLICGTLSALSMVAYALAYSLPFILLSRVLAGVAAANVVVGQAYIADITTEEGRSAAMGRVGVAITSGLILGPAIGGFLADYGGNHLLGTVAALASGLSVIWILLGVASLPPTQERHPGKRPVVDWTLMRDVPEIKPLLILATAASLALACLEGTFGRLLKHRLHFDESIFGIMFSYESLLAVLVQAFLIGSITARFSTLGILRTSFLAQGVGLGITPFCMNLPALFAASTSYGIGVGVSNPTLNSLLSSATPEERQGEMFGLLQGARSIGFILGPILGGMLFDLWMPAPYILAGSVVALVGVLVAYAVPQKAVPRTTTA